MVEAKFKAGGAVLLGKLATHEFALGGPSFDLPFPPARNPWNLAHFTGGSSSGSGAAVAAGLVRMAMGSDTGGSIRGPAFYCGTVGLKPTYGLVSRRGVFPLSYTLDHCGPLAWTVEDAALTMQVIAGHDSLDPASADLPAPDFTSGLGRDLAGLKLAYPRSFFAKRASHLRSSRHWTRPSSNSPSSAPRSRRSRFPTSSCSMPAAASSSPPRPTPSTSRTC